MDDIYKNIEDYNPNNNQKIFILFYDMNADTQYAILLET